LWEERKNKDKKFPVQCRHQYQTFLIIDFHVIEVVSFRQVCANFSILLCESFWVQTLFHLAPHYQLLYRCKRFNVSR